MMLEAHPDMRAKGFKRSLLDAFGGESAELRSILYQVWMVPDVHRVTGRDVEVFEVIVWHDLKPHKLNAYGDLKQDLKRHDITLTVTVVSENGGATELSLEPLR